MRIGIDIGGTFTDFVLFDPHTGQIRTHKRLSTPENPAQAVLDGLEELLDDSSSTLEIVHGSTVATNALLERRGAQAALVTTRGFRDVLEIGRQDRPKLYDLAYTPLPPLIPAERRLEAGERIDRHGDVLEPLDECQIEALCGELQDMQVESVAVCLLFSFLNPEHEQRIAQALRSHGLLVSVSSEILPEFREYERTSTTVINAYVSPVLDRYLSALEAGLSQRSARLRVMQSNGGHLSPTEAGRFGARCILSGPAGGLVGSAHTARAALKARNEDAGTMKVITFDMGGTSTDVSLLDGEPQITTEAVVGGSPVRLPMLDIHTIGAGGGSIARVDLGGALRVGPQSAGSDPGPACYGRGEVATVTDANLVLGRLAPDFFLGGRLQLQPERAWRALERLGQQMGISPVQAASGVVAVANAHMERALRVISVERGHDPADFLLLSFGGAGGLHAADLGRELGVRAVLVPPLASTLSAYGMLAADVVKDYSQTVMLSGDVPPLMIEQALQPLLQRGAREMAAEGFSPERIHLQRQLDLRYRGQSFELTLPWAGPQEDLLAAFHAQHQQSYGYAREAEPVEVVNVRVRAAGRVQPPLQAPLPSGGPDPNPALVDHRLVTLSVGKVRLPLYQGERLRSGNRISGPALVVRTDTTVLLGPQDHGEVDGFGNLWIWLSSTRSNIESATAP